MKTLLSAIALSAALATSAGAQTMSDGQMIGVGHAMLIAQVSNSLSRQNIPADGVENLTLNEVVQLSEILDDEDTPTSAMRSQAVNLLEGAQGR